MAHTIDMTPTWEGLLPAMLMVLDNPDASFESRKVVTEELTRMARAADNCITMQKQESLAKEVCRDLVSGWGGTSAVPNVGAKVFHKAKKVVDNK